MASDLTNVYLEEQAIIKLIEECSELIHILCKVYRFGWNSYHPDDKSKELNYYHVVYEMNDVEKRIKELRDVMIGGVVEDIMKEIGDKNVT